MINPVGYFKIHRELASKAIWERSSAEQKVILITLLMMANFSEKQWEWQGRKFTAKPGQFITSLDSIAKNAGPGISKQNVRTALKRFENLGFLTNQSTHTGRLITIINWGLYQSDESKLTKQPTKGQHSANIALTPREEGKKDKKVRKDIYRRVQHLELTDDDFKKLHVKYSQEDIDDVLDQMENWAGLKKYKSAYMTANNWLKRREKDKQQTGNKKRAFGSKKSSSKNYDDLTINMMEDDPPVN